MTATMKHAAPGRATITTPAEREIRIERIFNASRDRVWDAFTKLDLIKQWWGRGNNLIVEKFEPERGGHWRFVERTAEGDHGFEGRYSEVTPKSRIVQTFEWDGMPGHVSLETIELEDLGDGRTRIVNTSLFHTKQDRDGMLQSGMEGGLNESYESLDRVLAAME